MNSPVNSSVYGSVNSPVNILLVGVGGQGIVRAGDLIAEAALHDGRDVKKSEIHGMSQRGGSVTSHVRYGRQVFSPVIVEGQADVLLSFERLEAIRYIAYLRPRGLAIVNDQAILPAPVLAGAATYPEDLESIFAERGRRLSIVDGTRLATEAGNRLTVNVALLGIVSRHLDLPEDAWQAALKSHVKPAFLDVNRKAFDLGRKVASF